MRHVLILALDTSSPSGSVALLRDSEVLSYASIADELRSSRMFRQIDSMLREVGVQTSAVDLFAAATGPGSFTGLRIGLAAVKGWAEVYGKPIAAVSALEAVAAQSQSLTERIVPVLDARRGQLYFAVYQRTGTNARADGYRLAPHGNESVGTPEEFLAAIERVAGSDGSSISIPTPVPELLQDLLSRSETKMPVAVHPRLQLEPVSPILAPHVGRIGLRQSREGKLTDALSLDANYVRRSDAELHWKVPAGS